MNVAIVGLGVVGKGVYDILTADFETIKVSHIVELDTAKLSGINPNLVSTFEETINDESVDVVIELIGGKTVAYRMIKQALKANKHVVTANKAVISDYYEELINLAKQNNVNLMYEASVGGAIIVLDPLFTISKVNKVHQIDGIINGCTNFVLSKLFLENKALDETLEEATKLGYIETGSTDDMDGLDLMRKINILSMIAYDTFIDESSIYRVPLSTITSAFYEYVKDLNLTMKYIATSKLVDSEISIHLEPVILSKNHFYNTVNYEENMIRVHGAYHKIQSFIGQGAGRYPTAQAVINDLVLLESGVKRTKKYQQKYQVNQIEVMNEFLIQTTTGFVKEYTSHKQLQNRSDILCFARIEGDEIGKI